MEQDDFLKDDFLREIIKRSPLEAPSDDFVDRVMAGIQVVPETEAVKKPFYLDFRGAIPYAVIALVCLLVIATSDLPIFNWLPGKDYFMNYLLPSMGTLMATLKSAFATKFVSWVVLISVSAGMLYFIDRLFSRRTMV